MENSDSLSNEIHAAISEVYRKRGGLVNRWVCTIEAVQEDASRATAYLTSPDMQLWEVIGMTEATSEYARTQLQIAYTDGIYEGLEEDDEEA